MKRERETENGAEREMEKKRDTNIYDIRPGRERLKGWETERGKDRYIWLRDSKRERYVYWVVYNLLEFLHIFCKEYYTL